MTDKQHEQEKMIATRKKYLSDKPRLHATSCFVLFIILFCFPMCFGQMSNLKKRVEFPTDSSTSFLSDLEFNNIAVEQQSSGRVYVGARNGLYQLNDDLSGDIFVSTGPVDDTKACQKFQTECDGNVNADNTNKLLLIDYKHTRVVACGNVNQGMCHLYQQGNVQHILDDLKISKISSAQLVAAPLDLSTVGFIASSGSNNTSLYVGSSKTFSDAPRLDILGIGKAAFYALSNHQLQDNNGSPDMFSSMHFDISTGVWEDAGVVVDRAYAQKGYRVQFVGGFATDETGYFIMTHPSSNQLTFNPRDDTTYIAQICLNEKSVTLRSYLELPLECESRGFKYTKAVASRTAKVGSLLASELNILSGKGSNYQTDVVFVSFVQHNGAPGSAVCMFPLNEIEDKFSQLVQRCMKGSGGSKPRAIEWLKTRGKTACGVVNFGELQRPVCRNREVWDVISFLQDYKSSTIFVKDAVYLTNTTTISAIEVTPSAEADHTVAFFGTQDGKMIKFRIDSSRRGDRSNVEYETIVIDGSISGRQDSGSLSAVKTIHLGYGSTPATKRVYAMTSTKIVGLPLYDCSRYTDCIACLGSRDPFCGWCTLENKCSASSDCDIPTSGKRYYFIKSDGGCPKLTSDQPLTLPTSEYEKTISLKGYNIPMLNSYECSFGNLHTYKPPRPTNRGTYIEIDCISPPLGSMPKFDKGKGEIVVPLSLTFDNGGVLVSTNFTFYKCSVYTSCMSCVATSFGCTWCNYDRLCTHDTATDCQLQGHVQQADSCPQLTNLLDGSNKIYVAGGNAAKTITLPAKRLPDHWRSFQCEITYNDGLPKQSSIGRKSGSTIECTNVVGTLPANARSTTAALRVIVTGKDKPQIEIDNPVNLSIEIYKCALREPETCGTCLQSPEKWKCRWCGSSNNCENEEETCRSWLDASSGLPCQNPRITDFSPTSAPFGGVSTAITLLGSNFDRDMNMQINVAGVTCVLQRSNCCEAQCIPKARLTTSGKITLCITENSRCRTGNVYNTTSTKVFSFVDPIVESFAPKESLQGWGTEITLKGEHLDTGTNVSVIVDGVPCAVDRSTLSSKNLVCQLQCGSSARRKRELTSSVLNSLLRGKRSTSTAERRIMVIFDGVYRIAQGGYFIFKDQVSINSITPLKTIQSGGLPLTIKGTNLHLIQRPQIKVMLPGSSVAYRGPCTYGSNSLNCTSPDLTRKLSAYKRDVFVQVGIESRGCHMVIFYDDKLVYSPDPILELFEGDDHIKTFRDELIYITGKNLCPDRSSCVRSTVTVLLGEDLTCEVRRLDIDQIACMPPAVGSGSYSVKVLIGGYQSIELGKLSYVEGTPISFTEIGAIIGVVIVIIIAVLVVVCVYRRRAKKSDEEVKQMVMQMSQMESRVAKACKEAFAELQTDMSQLDTVGGAGIPYLDYRTYLVRVLFPDPFTSDAQHALLLSYPNGRSDIRTNSHRPPRPPTLGMERFNKLLENRVFLLSFIRALERQRSFTMKEKATVAGLILVILQNRLIYATEILEQLLADLIQKNMEGRNHPKLLLRRTESVAEKMLTHWFSMLLHRFVVECAGEPLFILHRAIKQQVDKGPVDAYTNEARYSLSEDKLLRQTIEHDTITVMVSNCFTDRDHNDFPVKVLSCDSINQVKRKILDVAYMNQLYTYRPHPEDVDLEWHQKRTGRFILKDEDNSSKFEGDWKKVNTLEHYEVRNNDRIAIVPKQAPSVLSHSALSAASSANGLKRNGSGARLLPEGSNSSLPRHKPGSSRSGTPTLPQDGPKLCHLVKPNDQDQREGNDRVGKMVSEVYLTRLLTTKGTIQKYVDDLFETIFSVIQRGHTLPLAVKHMFDFLDRQAMIHGITDPEIVHTWKSNCLPLRFWVNLIKNPEFVFDVHKSPTIDCYLSVIAQAFMDSCSTTEYKLGKDSPSNKLLYAKDIPEYKKWVARYYSDVSCMPQLNPRDLSGFLQEESNMHFEDFNTQAALTQLYQFARKYSDEIVPILDSDPEARRQNLIKQFQYVSVAMDTGS